MSTTNREKRKIAKKLARRKAYEKKRNIEHGKKKKLSLQALAQRGANLPPSQLQPGEDPVEVYKRMKAEEAKTKQRESWGKVVSFCKNLFRGKQRGA